MTFSASDKEKLKEAFGTYCEITANKYRFVNDLDIEFSAAFEQKMEKLIKREKKPYFYLINTAAKRVACIIAALIIAVAGTVLSVDALREGVKNFIVEVYEKFSSVTLLLKREQILLLQFKSFMSLRIFPTVLQVK